MERGSGRTRERKREEEKREGESVKMEDRRLRRNGEHRERAWAGKE